MDKETQSKAEIKMGTTALHILLLSALAINYFVTARLNFMPTGLAFNRAYIVELFLLGVQDIFVSYMLWFIMDKNNTPLYIEDHKSGDVYQVLQVIKDRTDEVDTQFGSDINFEEDSE